jgi:hypothetical protein
VFTWGEKCIIYALLINASLQMVTVNGSAQKLLMAEL